MLRVVVREVASHQDWKTRRDVRTGGDEVSPVTAWRVITRCFSSFPCRNKTGCLISCLVLTRKYDMTSGRAPYGLLRGAVSHQVFLVKGEKKKCIQQLPECCTSASASFQETFGFSPIQMQSLSEVPCYVLFTKLAFKMRSCCPITATGGVPKPRDVREMGR